MGRITKNLEVLCRQEPSRPRNVVITLSETAQARQAAELGIDEVEEFQGLPGMFKGCLPGEKILELIQRQEIEEITEDFQVDMLTT